jgi:hypothetical protein
MADPSPDSVIVKTIGPFIGTAIGTLIGWLPGGSTGGIAPVLTALLALVGGISGLAFSLIYKRYLGVLAAGRSRKGSPAREAYDNLRASLSGDNLAARLYANWLTAFLDAVDRFFGDVGKADGTLFPRAFGLRTPAPLWTAPAFDRCLLLALIYPIATIFIIWAISGHVGPAEAALRLKDGLSAWQRGFAAATIGLSLFSAWRSTRTTGLLKSLFWLAVASGGTLVGSVAGAGTVSDAAFGAVIFAAEHQARRGAPMRSVRRSMPPKCSATCPPRPVLAGADRWGVLGSGIKHSRSLSCTGSRPRSRRPCNLPK